MGLESGDISRLWSSLVLVWRGRMVVAHPTASGSSLTQAPVTFPGVGFELFQGHWSIDWVLS